MANLKQIKVGNTTYNIEPYTAYVPKKYNNRFYPFIGSAHGGANYQVTLPISSYTSNGTSWMMITMELVLGGSYDGGATGKIFLSYYFLKNSNNVWSADHVRALGIGNKLADNGVSIQYNIRNPGIFYVHANKNTYNSFSIQNLTANDSASSFDFTTTLIQAVDSIPSELTSIPLTCLDSKGDNKLYVNNTAVSLDGHKHWSICDIGNDTATTFAYSKSGLNYDDYTWLAVWNGYELRSVNKSQFAKADHTHNYLPLGGGTMTGALNFNNNTWNTVGDDVYIGDYNQGGSLGIKGKNGQTNIGFVNQSNDYYIKLASPGVTANRTIIMPDDSGTMALTKNIPTIYDWAKSPNKPSYTASEVGAAASSHTHDYLPLDGSRAMSGTLILPINQIGLKFRDAGSWEVGTFYGSADNEALTFYSKSAKTSFQFICGSVPSSSNSWQTLTPGLQIRDNKVIINKQLANGVSSDYNLEVNGFMYASNITTPGTLDLSTSSSRIQFCIAKGGTPYFITNIEAGSKDVTLGAKNGAEASVNVTYHNGSKGGGTWYIVATAHGSYCDTVSVGIESESATGFKIWVRNVYAAASRTLHINWIAIKYH